MTLGETVLSAVVSWFCGGESAEVDAKVFMAALSRTTSFEFVEIAGGRRLAVLEV